MYLYALRNIHRGEELTFDYQLQTRLGSDKVTRARYSCRCGAQNCRGTMLAGGERNPPIEELHQNGNRIFAAMFLVITVKWYIFLNFLGLVAKRELE